MLRASIEWPHTVLYCRNISISYCTCVRRAEELDGLLDSVSRLRSAAPLVGASRFAGRQRRSLVDSPSRSAIDGRADGDWSGSGSGNGIESGGSARLRARQVGGWHAADRSAQTDSPARSTRSAQCEDESEWDSASARDWNAHVSSANGPGPGPGQRFGSDAGTDAGVWTGPAGRPRSGMSAQLDLSRSQIWEELAEAHLNQLIGQTDMLLASLSSPDDDQYGVSIDIDEYRATTSIDLAAPDASTRPFTRGAPAEATDASLFGSTRSALNERSSFGTRGGAERRSWRERMQRSTHSLAPHEGPESGPSTPRSSSGVTAAAMAAAAFARRSQIGGAASNSLRNAHRATHSYMDRAEASSSGSGSGSLADSNVSRNSRIGTRLPTDQLRSLVAVRTQMVRSSHRQTAPYSDLTSPTSELTSSYRRREDTHDFRQRQTQSYRYFML